MTPNEIIDYATRYMSCDEVGRFPTPGETFAFFVRELPADKVLQDDEGWQFAGYNCCIRYTLDEEAKPAGKWVWLEYLSLLVFPPRAAAFKLQPPHICRGAWQSPGRTHEYRMVVLDLNDPYGGFAPFEHKNCDEPTAANEPDDLADSNILTFPATKPSSRRRPRKKPGNDGE